MAFILSFDAGGTFTDSIILDGVNNKIISEGKALTTSIDLSVGIKNSLEISLSKAPLNVVKNIKLVVVSSTLATNSVVNSTGCRVGLILVGFDKSVLNNDNLIKACNYGEILTIDGGHDAEGNEKESLNLKDIDNFITNKKIESIAVASLFSTRNPNHENTIRDYIKNKTKLPITCSHDLSSELNGVKRAITCALNSSLTHIIGNLLEDINKILFEKSINARLMVVKGDGTLIDSKTAKFRPIDTTMSGPAASAIGALWLSGKRNAIVIDIGGTTTDISLIKSGHPLASKKGAKIGKWETMVEALSIFTVGLGGDSEVSFNRDNQNNCLNIGPKRQIPLSILAEAEPIILEHLQKQSNLAISCPTDGIFVWKKTIKNFPNWLSKIEKLTYSQLYEKKPLPLSDIAPNQSSYGAIYRLINYNLLEVSGFTPTDASHVLGMYNEFCTEASILGALILSNQKNSSGHFISDSKENISELVLKKLYEKSAMSIFDFTLTEKFQDQGKKAFFNNKIFQNFIFSNKKDIVNLNFKTKLPIISIGASANNYYPKIANLLNTKNITPSNFSVAGAVGAAVGSIKQTVKILITKGQDEKYKVHYPLKVQSYISIEKAIRDSKIEAKVIAEKKCLSIGAKSIKTKIQVVKNEFIISKNKSIFLECNVISTCYGKIL